MGSVGGALAPGVGARRCSGYSPNLRLLVSSGPGLHCQGSAHRPAGVWRKRGKVTVCTPFTLQVIGQTTCCFWSEVWYVPTFALWLDTLTKSFVVMHLTHPGKSKPARRCSSMLSLYSTHTCPIVHLPPAVLSPGGMEISLCGVPSALGIPTVHATPKDTSSIPAFHRC